MSGFYENISTEVSVEADVADAEAAKTAAEAAQTAAESARDTALQHKNAAEVAKNAAETAETSAESAESTATTAKTSAESARDLAETYKNAAETAKTAAETAETNATNLVASVSVDVQNVADNIDDINDVAGSLSSVNTVAGIESSITSVVANSANINAVANNEANINAAGGHASTASTKASEAATSATNAATSASNASTSETNAAASATAAAASAASIDPNDIDINGGTIDGVALGSTNTYTNINHTGTATFSTPSNAANLVLTSTDGDSGVGPLLRLYRNSPSPASGDITGSIQFRAENSADEDVNYNDMQALVADPTDGAETAEFKHRARINGSMREVYSIEEVVADSGNIEFVVNPNNVADVDFRVKADAGAAFFVDSSVNGYVGVRTSEPETALDVRGTVQIKGGNPSLDIIDSTVTGNLSQFTGENDGLRLNLKGSDSVNGGSFNLRQYNGSTYQTRFQIQSDGDIEMRDDANLIKFNFDASNGNVNIGASTADADALLRVEGDVRVVDANIRVDERLQIGSPNSTQAIDAALHIRGNQQGGFANFTGSGTAGSNVLTVTAVASGTLEVGDHVFGSTLLPAHMIITEQLSGTTGGVGTYEVSQDFPEDKSSGTLFAANTSPTSIRIENTDGGVSNAQSIGTIDFFDSDGTTDGVKGFIEAGAYDSTPDTYLAFGTNKQTEGTRETAREVGRFDHGGNLLVGKVRNVDFQTGIALQRTGQGSFTADGDHPIEVRRKTDHGNLFLGRAEGTSTARIMSVASTAEAPVYANGDGFGLKITSGAFLPWNGVPDTARDNIMDLGSGDSRFERLYLGSHAYIDGTTYTENLRVGAGATVDTILNQDGLTSNSATALATQRSIKAYVDANSGFVSGSVGTLEQVTQNGATAAATVTLGGLGVTGSTALDSAGASTLTLKRNGGTDSNTVIVFDQATADSYIGADSSNSFVIGHNLNLGVQRRAKFDQNGDVSLFEDTGTTAKFFWDSSAESLGIGTSSPARALHISTSADRIAKFESTDAGAFIVLEDSNSTSDYNRIGVTTHDMQFITNNSERMRIDSSGNLLVGKTSNTYNTAGTSLGSDGRSFFTADGSYAGAFNRKTSDGDIVLFSKNGNTVGSIGTNGGRLFIADDAQAGFAFASGANRVVPCNSSGTLTDATMDIGEPNYRFKDLYLSGDVNLANNSHISFASTACRIEGNSSGADFIKFITNSNEAARLDSSGNLLVGTTTADAEGITLRGDSHYLKVVRSGGVAAYFDRRTSDGTIVAFRRQGIEKGSVYVSSTATTYNTSSDQRLKENIVDAPSASDDIDAIQVRSFDWKADGSHQKYGMVAQELQTVAPEAVTEGETEDDMMGVDYSKLVPMLVKEIQSLRARVAQLEGAN
jgi:hypothetical protein